MLTFSTVVSLISSFISAPEDIPLELELEDGTLVRVLSSRTQPGAWCPGNTLLRIEIDGRVLSLPFYWESMPCCGACYEEVIPE